MDFFRSVHRQANQEMIVFEKLAPFFCNCITIGLKRILYLYMIPVVLVLKFNCFFEETNSAQGWFSVLCFSAFAHSCTRKILVYVSVLHHSRNNSCRTCCTCWKMVSLKHLLLAFYLSFIYNYSVCLPPVDKRQHTTEGIYDCSVCKIIAHFLFSVPVQFSSSLCPRHSYLYDSVLKDIVHGKNQRYA